MLLLTRKLGDRIEIDGRIEIAVLELRPGVVRLGVKAPTEINVLRSELVAAEPSRPDPQIE